jgi:hypothetical protein
VILLHNAAFFANNVPFSAFSYADQKSIVGPALQSRPLWIPQNRQNNRHPICLQHPYGWSAQGAKFDVFRVATRGDSSFKNGSEDWVTNNFRRS